VLLGATAGVNARLVARWGRYRLRFAATTLLGPALMLVGYSSTVILLMTSLMLVGATNSKVLMMGYTRRILATPHRFRTRVTAVNIMLAQLSAVAGPAVAGVMLLRASITSVYLIFGSSLLICSFGWVLTPDFRKFMSLDDHEVEGWYGIRYPEAFESEVHARPVG
jgi:MFS family permease